MVINNIVESSIEGKTFNLDALAEEVGLKSRLYSIQAKPGADFSDDTKTSVFLSTALAGAPKCPICMGYLDPSKSVSYDHVERKQDGGKGNEENCQLTHPYCNTSIKN